MKKNKLKLKKWVLVVPLLLIILIIGFIVYANVHGMYTNLKIKMNGDSKVQLEVGSEYKDKGINATYNKKSIKDITTKGKVDNKKIGVYKIKYIVKYKKNYKKIMKDLLKDNKEVIISPTEITEKENSILMDIIKE